MRGRAFVLAAISHDLRTYLTRLRLRVEMVPDADLRERAARDVEDMNALLEDALVFARTSFSGSRPEAVDLVGIVRHECAERAATGGAVRAELPNPQRLLVAGQFATVTAESGVAQPALLIPQAVARRLHRPRGA